MKYNYQIIIEYLGANFVGWQIQKNGTSIQEVLQKKLKKVFQSNIKLIGSGRTDKGVNAWRQSANFYLDKKIDNKKKAISSINFFLNKFQISVIDLKKKDLNFHARFSARKRIYEYFIVNEGNKLSIYDNRAWLVRKRLDIKKMKRALNFLIGTHDFSSFRASSCGADSPVRTITKANIIKKDSKIIINFVSKSFLQQQVRSMVGCLKYVGENKWTLNHFKKVLKSRKRKLCAPPAPPQGLYLKKVIY